MKFILICSLITAIALTLNAAIEIRRKFINEKEKNLQKELMVKMLSDKKAKEKIAEGLNIENE